MFAKPAYPRNDYLTNGTNSCRTGEVDVRIETENRDDDYRHNSSSNNYDNNSEFKNIYLHKLMRFTLAYYRGTNTRCLGWSIRELPKIPATTTDLYKLANLTEEEIVYVESVIK